jgi:hypothetical protein
MDLLLDGTNRFDAERKLSHDALGINSDIGNFAFCQ